MKCIFKHNWVYSERGKAIYGEHTRMIYQKRTCAKCERVEQQDGYFDSSFGMINNWRNKWVRIG